MISLVVRGKKGAKMPREMHTERTSRSVCVTTCKHDCTRTDTMDGGMAWGRDEGTVASRQCCRRPRPALVSTHQSPTFCCESCRVMRMRSERAVQHFSGQPKTPATTTRPDVSCKSAEGLVHPIDWTKVYPSLDLGQAR
jgi:hypothetical protein